MREPYRLSSRNSVQILFGDESGLGARHWRLADDNSVAFKLGCSTKIEPLLWILLYGHKHLRVEVDQPIELVNGRIHRHCFEAG